MSLFNYFRRSHESNINKRNTETAFNLLTGSQRQIVQSSLGLIGKPSVRTLGLTGTNFDQYRSYRKFF